MGNICNGWKVCANRTTSMPKSVPHLVLDKVRLVFMSGVLNSNHPSDGMDVTVLTTLRPIFIVTLV